jgi:hypothetical protein
MFSAAVRVLARAATIQLEEAAAAHPRPPRTLLKGKERVIPIRREQVSKESKTETGTDLGIRAGLEGIGGENEMILEELVHAGHSAGPSRPPPVRRETAIVEERPTSIPSHKLLSRPQPELSEKREEAQKAPPTFTSPAQASKPERTFIPENVAATSKPVIPPSPPPTVSSPPVDPVPSTSTSEPEIRPTDEAPLPLVEEDEEASGIPRTSRTDTDAIGSCNPASVQGPFI